MTIFSTAKEDIYRTMRDVKDLLKRTSKGLQGLRIQAQQTWRILDDIDFFLAEDSPQEKAAEHIKCLLVAKLIIAFKEGSSSQATIAGLDQEWKTMMQDRLKNCAKTVEADEKEARFKMRRAVFIASVASIAGALGFVAAIALTGGVAAVVLGSVSIAGALSVIASADRVVDCASIGVGLRAATDKEIMDKLMSEARQMSNAVLSGLGTLSENAGKIDNLLHKLDKTDAELAIQCLDDAESAQLRECMERFKDDNMKCEAQLEDLIETFDRTILPVAVKLQTDYTGMTGWISDLV